MLLHGKFTRTHEGLDNRHGGIMLSHMNLPDPSISRSESGSQPVDQETKAFLDSYLELALQIWG